MGKSKELAELGQVVSQSGGNVGVGSSLPEELLHLESAGVTGIKLDGAGDGAARISSSYGIINIEADVDSENSASYIRFRNHGDEHMRIDASGRVTMPYQPSFFARPQSGYSFTAAADQTIGGTWSVQSNVGNHFNASGGAFTAPVQGVYAFSWAVFITGNLTTRQDAYILVNGSPRIRVEINAYSAGTQNRSQHAHGSIRLAANDVVTFGAYATVSSGQPSIYPTTAPWSYASGVLIG